MWKKPCEGRVTSSYGLRRHPITKREQFHRGIDFGADGKDAVYASAPGIVEHISKGTTGYGLYVILRHERGWRTLYAHLKSIDVREQQAITKQRIGRKGSTGNSTGIHLHFELHRGPWNARYTHAVDPAGYVEHPTIYVRRGVVGPRVSRIQRALNGEGFQLVVDERFGVATERAVRQFQKRHHLVVDGIVGPATFRALKLY